MGYRKELYQNGVLISVVDTRNLAEEKLERIKQAKEEAGIAILAAYPAYKQQNAALGLLPEAEAEAIKQGIQAIRTACDAKETAIDACETLAELDAI